MSWADYDIPDCVLRSSYRPAKGLYLATKERYSSYVIVPSFPEPEFGKNTCNIFAWVDWCIFCRSDFLYWDLDKQQKITRDDLLSVYGNNYLGCTTFTANPSLHPDCFVPFFSRDGLVQRVNILKMFRFREIGLSDKQTYNNAGSKRVVYIPSKTPAFFYYTLDGINWILSGEQDALSIDYTSRDPYLEAVIYDMDREYQFKCKED